MDDKHLEELFAPPIGLELEAVVDGQKFYSSQKLKEAFVKSMGATGRASHIFKQVEKLVMKKKLIVPCYLSKNMYRLFKHKLMGGDDDKSILGFYHIQQKRVFILIDNSVTPIGTAKNDFIASTTMHECVHLYADRMKSKFLKTFKQELERFYISYFSRTFQLKTKPDVTKTVKFISMFEYKRSEQINKKLAKYYYLLEKTLKPHSQLNDRDFTAVLQTYIVSIKLSLMNFTTFLRIL